MFPSLFTHLRVHKIMQKFDNVEWNRFIGIFSQPKMKNLIYGESRDNILKMVFKIFLANPSLIRYVKYL